MDLPDVEGNKLEFIQINNNGDEDVDLTGIYLRELGVTYQFPHGLHLAARDSLVLCSDSTTYIQYYNNIPFGEYQRKLSNKSEKIVIADAWGNVIDEVHYADSDPWPTEPDGNGAYLQLIDLDLDNSLAENWIAAIYHDNVETVSENGFAVYPNPSRGTITVEGDGDLVITSILGQIVLTKRIVDRENINLDNGVYILTINGKTARIIINKNL